MNDDVISNEMGSEIGNELLAVNAFLGNRVFADTDGNGIHDDGDIGVDGVLVTLSEAGQDGIWGTTDDVELSQTTTNGGYFGFDGLAEGQYRVAIDVPEGWTLSPFGQDPSGEFDSDANPQTGETATITLASGEYNGAIDIGLIASDVQATNGDQAPASTVSFNYGEALQKSFLFYEAQRSGALPSDNRITWRGNSALDDGQDVGLDLSGGYFDAGDHTKFNYPMAAAMTLLSWGVQSYQQGYEQAGQLDEALDAIRWGTDFLLKSHVTENGKTKEFWTQVGDPSLDQAVLELPELLSTERPSLKIDAANPGSDMASEAAAALASASIIFRPSDSAYADRLLDNAIQLYDFADTYRGSYSTLLDDATSPYVTNGLFEDELTWGAIWIHRALEAQGSDGTTYLAKAESAYDGLDFTWTQDWDNKSHGAAVLLAQATSKETYRNDVTAWLDNWQPDGGVASPTTGGLAWLSAWGSLRLSANTAFIAGIYADTVADPDGRYSAFAEGQIDYILGDNPRGASYVVGFGENSPQRVHHQAAAQFLTDEQWESDLPNTNIIYGALVGGPTAPNDFSYQDDRTDFFSNEVSLEYNAGFTGALARMYSQYGGQPLSDAQLNALPGIQVQTEAQVLTSLPLDSSETDSSETDSSETDITMVAGTSGDDIDLTGTEGDDDVLGGAGNDSLIALGGNDHLYGTDAVARGLGEQDYLAGGAGADIFFLGDANGAYYAAQGWNDFAWISDFEVGADQLWLSGSASDYSLVKDETVTWIIQGSAEAGEAIAGLANAPDVSLEAFLYSQSANT